MRWNEKPKKISNFMLTIALGVVHGELNSLYMISGSCQISQKYVSDVTDVTDGLIFMPLLISSSQF